MSLQTINIANISVVKNEAEVVRIYTNNATKHEIRYDSVDEAETAVRKITERMGRNALFVDESKNLAHERINIGYETPTPLPLKFLGFVLSTMAISAIIFMAYLFASEIFNF